MQTRAISGMAMLVCLALLLAASHAQALTCPLPQDLKLEKGRWSAPGGWEQSEDVTFGPQARLIGWALAYYKSAPEYPLAAFACSYNLQGQSGIHSMQIAIGTKGRPQGDRWHCANSFCTCWGQSPADCPVK